MSDWLQQWQAVRYGVGLSRHDHLRLVRMPADEGLARLDPIVATSLELREAQVRQGLVLDDQGRPRVDLLVGMFRGELIAFADALDPGELDELGPAVEDHVIFGLDGPFAWECLGAWDTPTAIGLPYLSAYAPADDRLVVRAGRAGEFGYLIVVPAGQADAVHAELTEQVARFSGRTVDREVLRRCSLENWVFEIDRDGRFGLDALELQLTWRLDLGKAARGLDAIRQHRADGLRRRIVAVRAEGPVEPGAALIGEPGPLGEVLFGAPAVEGEDHHAVAAMPADHAQAGLPVTIDGIAASTVSAPFRLNVSLFVNPQRHAHATRDEIELPGHLKWPGS